MRLSIVIPTRNRPDFLSKCLDSLAAENVDAKDTQVIAVDDGSDGENPRKYETLCERHGASLIRLNKRCGQAYARNCGIRSSAGEWIVFLDDDVIVEKGWYRQLLHVLSRTPLETVGIEGRVVPEGEGMWDREVQNTTGGLYITCHVLYRSDLLKRIDGFDDKLLYYCEDHELAARMLRWGPIVFEPTLTVTHAARRINAVGYLLESPQRIRLQLEAEYYFFMKQRDRYHLFRHCTTFFGTYLAILFKNVWSALRRRSVSRCVRHPLQCAVLIASCLVEQAVAWLLLPFFICRYLSRQPSFIGPYIDAERSSRFWKFAEAKSADAFALCTGMLRLFLSPLFRRPVYSAELFLRRHAAPYPRRCFLRVDDVFVDNTDAVDRLCEITSREKIPFLAAVVGNQLVDRTFAPTIKKIYESGGEIGLHGFVHQGVFGPYNSEILQLQLPRLSAMAQAIVSVLPRELRPFAFIPPFNAISRAQILHLSRIFKVICGGPETARFTDRIFGPVALKTGAWYVPAFHPYYQRASGIVRSRAFATYGALGCNICFAVHLCDEVKNGFTDFEKLVKRIAPTLASWTLFRDGRGSSAETDV